ncbi:hypothetical protein FISHEDRAFT_67751 [Fistulina hepatica ATCC 64428]|nr:hypothetical protein FISHEDRAFT_67751 [Fistulina hepatica ATCC 64428]
MPVLREEGIEVPDFTTFSPSRSRVAESRAMSLIPEEVDPLLAKFSGKKPFYRARPLWLVPFALFAALVRGMTLASRVQVFTKLSCNHVYAPSLVPHSQCLSDPRVQAGAAQLQTIMSLMMGILAAMTTGWWQHYGERRGRVRVLSIATFGLLLTDLAFAFVSTASFSGAPSDAPWVVWLASPRVARVLILTIPAFEGLLGGWATLQAACSAYVSDCTSAGSRSHIFSRFTGVFFLGSSIGPGVGGWIIRHSQRAAANGDVTTVFYAAAACSVINFILALVLFPESLSRESMARARAGVAEASSPLLRGLTSSLSIFAPVHITDNVTLHKRRDWSLTVVAVAFFGFMVCTGIFQIRYLYAEHVYGWGGEPLSYFISFMSGSRAICLLFIMPGAFKPKSMSKDAGGKLKITKSGLLREIRFDAGLARTSLLIDILSNVLVVLIPQPSAHSLLSSTNTNTDQSRRHSAMLFVLASWLTSFGSSVIPSVQSLALCIVQARALADPDEAAAEGAGVGKVFGGLSLIQAIGQLIIGPTVFGVMYSQTVAKFPQAIFTTAAVILMSSFCLLCIMRYPLSRPERRLYNSHSSNSKGKARVVEAEVRRGRSRISKDLRATSSQSHGLGIPSYGAMDVERQDSLEAGPSGHSS